MKSTQTTSADMIGEQLNHSKQNNDGISYRIKEAPDSTTIVHISDLHYDGSAEWLSNYSILTRKIVALSPSLVIVTGDLVDEPSEKLFSGLSSQFEMLAKEISGSQDNHSFGLISIPGNHDYYEKGYLGSDVSINIDLDKLWSLIDSKLFRPLRWIQRAIIWLLRKKLQADANSQKLFIKHANRLQFFYKNGISITDTSTADEKDDVDQSKYLELIMKPFLIEIYKTFDIAIFPFDSAQPIGTGIMSMGHVREPDRVLDRLSAVYKSIKPTTPYSNCFKLALLHHHPLPPISDRPSNGHDLLEGSLILQNSAEFLMALSANQVDLVLHGHKHIDSCTEYQHLPTKSKHLIISSCGSSCKRGEALHFRNYQINKANGEVSATDFDSYKSGNVLGLQFKPRQEHPYTMIGYDARRRMRNANIEGYPLHYENQSVRSVALKRKQVTINANGDGLNQIILDGISFSDFINPEDINITEIMRSDFGRIANIRTAFSQKDTPLAESPADFLVTNAIESKRPPDGPELYEHTFNPTKIISDPSSGGHCEILALAFNSYATTTRQFHEMYRKDVPAEEVCSVQAHYPTETMELLILFGEGVEFPKRHHISVKATSVPGSSGSTETQLSTLLNRLPLNHHENFYIEKNIALRISEEIKAITLFVRQPQPDVQYTIRWRLPETNEQVITNSLHLKAEELREQLLKDSELQISFYSELHAKLVSILSMYLESFNEEDLQLAILGIECNDWHYLKVVTGSRIFEPEKKMLINRGVAGKAFRNRSLQYWERLSGTDEQAISSPENITKEQEFKPTHILSIPVYCPSSNNESPPIIAVISIILLDYNESFSAAMKEMQSTIGHPTRREEDVLPQDSDRNLKHSITANYDKKTARTALKNKFRGKHTTQELINEWIKEITNIKKTSENSHSTKSSTSTHNKLASDPKELSEALRRVTVITKNDEFFKELESFASRAFDIAWNAINTPNNDGAGSTNQNN